MKLNTRRTILVGLAFMTISGFWQLYDFMVPLILKNVFEVSDTVSGIVMSLDNVLALVLMPTFGAISDRTTTKYGKRMPFIVIGTFLTATSLLLLPTAAIQKSLIMFVIGLAIILLSVATYRSPAVALMPDVTIKPLRSKGNAIINLMGTVGGIVVLVFVQLLGPEKTNSYLPAFLTTSIFMIVPIIIMILRVKENQWTHEANEISKDLDIEDVEHDDVKLAPAVKRSLIFLLMAIAFWFMGYNAVISAFSRYATLQIGISLGQAALSLQLAQVGALVSFLPIGVLSSKIGRKRTIQIGVVVLATAFGTAYFYTSFSGLIYLNFIAAGFGWAAINVNSLPMVLEMAKGSNVGKFTGYYYAFSMSAQIVTPILSGVLFDQIGYQVLFPYAAFFVALSFIMVLFVKHGDSKLSDYKDVLLEEDI